LYRRVNLVVAECAQALYNTIQNLQQIKDDSETTTISGCSVTIKCFFPGPGFLATDDSESRKDVECHLKIDHSSSGDIPSGPLSTRVVSFPSASILQGNTVSTFNSSVLRCVAVLTRSDLPGYKNYTHLMRGLQTLADVSQMWGDINDLSDAVCASLVSGTKLTNPTQHRELHRQDVILGSLRRLSHDHQYSVYLTLNTILNTILNTEPDHEYESWMDRDEQLRELYIFKVSRTLWLLRVGPKAPAGMYDAGTTPGTFLLEQECEEFQGADNVKVKFLL
jgi:hypothetical protein